jgi:hypothetical protein
MNNPVNAACASGKPTDEPRFAPDEEQPESFSNERDAKNHGYPSWNTYAASRTPASGRLFNVS